MKNFNPLIVCLACSITLPAMAAESTGEYSSLRPKTEMEGAPEALSGAKLREETLTVESVDMANRLVTLQGPEGKMVTVMADARVKNLDQVKKGDKVHVGYYEAMAVELVAPGAATSQPAVKTAKASAEKGAKPAGGVARQTSTTVQILSVDPYKKAISFRDADGRWREVSMAKPELQHYLTDLKEGDTVQVTYTEALAVSVEPR
jgi:hypothetical protein